MKRTVKVIGVLLRVWWVLLLVPMVSGMARGAEFTALMMVKDGAKAIPGKIYVLDGKMRQEFVDEGGRTITIVRPDRKVVWVILSRQQTYLEMPLTQKLPGQFIQIPPGAQEKRLAGREQVSGYETEKYEVKVPIGRNLENQTFWVAGKLGLPIRMECRPRQFSMEYQSIKEEKVPDRLFDLPPGLTKVTSLGGFADQVD